MRIETWDLAEGFGTARWRDDEDTLCQLHPGWMWLEGYEGRNPVTRERVSVPSMLHVAGFIRLGEKVVLDASFEMGPRGLRSMRLTPSQTEDSVDPGECLTWMARTLRLEVQAAVEEQSWVAQGTRVELQRDGVWFTLVIHAPGGS